MFTNAVVKAHSGDWRSFDANGNGAFEISEIYGAVKSTVIDGTTGDKTPWLVRQDLVANFAIF